MATERLNWTQRNPRVKHLLQHAPLVGTYVVSAIAGGVVYGGEQVIMHELHPDNGHVWVAPNSQDSEGLYIPPSDLSTLCPTPPGHEINAADSDTLIALPDGRKLIVATRRDLSRPVDILQTADGQISIETTDLYFYQIKMDNETGRYSCVFLNDNQNPIMKDVTSFAAVTQNDKTVWLGVTTLNERGDHFEANLLIYNISNPSQPELYINQLLDGQDVISLTVGQADDQGNNNQSRTVFTVSYNITEPSSKPYGDSLTVAIPGQPMHRRPIPPSHNNPPSVVFVYQ